MLHELLSLQFHFSRFPTDSTRRERWTARLRRQCDATNRLWKPGRRAVVCSDHFHPSDFYWQWGRKLIKPDSEPTIFSFTTPTRKRKPPTDRDPSGCSGEQLLSEESIVDSSAARESYSQAYSTSVNHDHQYAVKSPSKLSRQVDELTKRLHDKTVALRNARKRERRLHGRVANLLKRLKNMQLLSEQAEALLDIFKTMPLHLLSGKMGARFTEEQKQFAITLHYYSPAAYQYVRRRFKLLPGSRTIRRWLSAIAGCPGLTRQSFDTISEKIKGSDGDSWSYKVCSLHIDEMEIKKQLEIDRSTGKVYGFTDIGSGINAI